MCTIETKEITPFSYAILPYIRTINTCEATTDGKIGPYWAAFMQQHHSLLQPTSNIIASYSNYESDYTGPYDFALGIISNDIPEGFMGKTVSAGRYMIFADQGPSPEVIIKTWNYIWHYFSQPSAPKRAYTVDFEIHDMARPGFLQIYIALQ